MVKNRRGLAIPLSFWLLSMIAALALGAAPAEEPVIGGRCENCELVFAGMPSSLGSQARIAPASEPGEPLVLTGTVRARDGKPAAGVVVYAYHTDRGGIYPRGDCRHGRLRGWAKTDSGGNYRFDTIRPGAYPDQAIPQHIHMHVIEPGRGTYWIDDVHFEDDPLLKPAMRRHLENGRGGAGLVRPSKDAAGVWQARRDIALGENIPGDDAPDPRP